MKKVLSIKQPSAIKACGKSKYLYHWDIEVVESSAPEDDSMTQWQCNEVVVSAPLTKSKILEAVISALWSSAEEQKLMNDFIAVQQGVLDEPCAEGYLEFLSERKRLKEQIATDYAEWSELTK